MISTPVPTMIGTRKKSPLWNRPSDDLTAFDRQSA
jgi:hypothetical protein